MAERIHETVVVTRNAEGEPHVVPMGVRWRDDGVRLAPFRPSTTLDNLLEQGEATINQTNDVRVIAGCLTGRRAWPLAVSSQVAAPRLDGSLAHTEIRVVAVADDPLRPEVSAQVVHQHNHRPFPGFNRAQAAVLEAAILVSRLDRLPWEKIEREIGYLRIAIEKTAGPEEQEAWQWLMERVDAHSEALQTE